MAEEPNSLGISRTASRNGSNLPPLPSRTIVVTGGSGFIGSELVIRLAQFYSSQPEPYRVHLLLRKYSDVGRIITAVGRTGLVSFARGDLEDKSFVARELNESVEYIYHVAAQGRDWGPWLDYYNANVVVTRNLLEVACEKCKNLRRFLHVSTVDVYEPSRPTSECHEDVEITTKRHAYYSTTKAMAEKEVLKAAAEHNLPITILRPAVVFGPGSMSWGLEEAQILYKGKGVLINHGRATCGAIYLDDVVSALPMAATSPKTVGKIYNLSDNQNLTWKEYFDAIARGIGVPPARRSVPYWLAYIVAWLSEWIWWILRKQERPLLTIFVLALIGRDQKYPIHRAYEDFGWKPVVPFQEGMARTIRWLLETKLYMDE